MLGNLNEYNKNAYNALEHLLVILHRIIKNARYNYQNYYTFLLQISM
jgi:hypothetical protein